MEFHIAHSTIPQDIWMAYKIIPVWGVLIDGPPSTDYIKVNQNIL